MLEYLPVTLHNLEEAIAVQAAIFHESFPREIIDGDGLARYGLYNYAEFWLVRQDGQTIGITGLYGYRRYPDDAFMNWFGVMPSARRGGLGRQILDWTVETARRKGFRHFRLYTEAGDNDAAIALYRKAGMVEETYTREFGVKNIVFFSVNLDGQPVIKWNNRYLAIWSGYLLYAEHPWSLIKSDWSASLAAFVCHPTTLWALLFKRKKAFPLGKA